MAEFTGAAPGPPPHTPASAALPPRPTHHAAYPPRDAFPHALAIIDDLLPPLVQKIGVPGVSVYLSHPPTNRSAARYLGVANLATRQPMGPATRFRIGSMSKPILASLALALVSKGILELDEPVLPRLKSWHLPQSRSDGLDTSRITLRRLLSHSAGFNVHSYPDRHHTAPPVTIQQVLNGIDNPVECLTRLTSQPGTLVSYTGAGLSIVQVLIEDTLGVPYIHALREHLLGPLGLDATSAAPNDIPGMELSACHSGGISNNLVDPPPGNPRTPFELHTVGALGASGLFSSPRDVAKVFELPLPGPDNAPPGRGIIREDLARAMIQDQRHGAQGDMWGLGVLLYRSPKGTISYRHGGQRQAWFIHAEGSAGQNLVVTMMANADYLGACAINPVIAQIRKALALFEP